MKKLIVSKKYDNKKLNKFLQDNFPSLSNNLFYKTLRKKDIKINGKRVSEEAPRASEDCRRTAEPDSCPYGNQASSSNQGQAQVRLHAERREEPCGRGCRPA